MISIWVTLKIHQVRDRDYLQSMHHDAHHYDHCVEDDHTTSEYVTTDPDDELMNEDLDFTPCFGKVGIDLW